MQKPLPASAGPSADIPLRGPTSQSIVLEGDGAKVFAWSPSDRRQCEIELRARIVGCSAVLGDIPVIRWATEIGHGDAVLRQPQSPLSVIAGSPIIEYSLPARGMVWRTNAREFRISFRNQGTTLLAPLARSELQVSVLPTVGGMERPLYPYTHSAVVVPGSIQHPFPMEAREFRILDIASVAFPAGPGIVYLGISGALFGPVALSAVADWTPIPHEANAWIPSVPCYAYYR